MEYKLGSYKEEISSFEEKTKEAFRFLENDFGLKRMELKRISLNDFRDAEIKLRYSGRAVAVDLYWDFPSAYIGASIIETINGSAPEKYSTFVRKKDFGNAISLYSLVEVIDPTASDEFLLKFKWKETMRNVNKRAKIINESMDGILENLAYMLKKYASNILEGDTSIFPQVQDYEKEQRDRIYQP